MTSRKNDGKDGDSRRARRSVSPSSRHQRARLLDLILVPAAIVLLLDLLTKGLVRTIPLATQGVIAIRPVQNKGTLFSLFAGFEGINLIFIAISLIAISALVYVALTDELFRSSRLAVLSAGLMLGGILGNLFDRIAFAAVFDWISIWKWPVFNIADSAIVIGVAIILLLLIKDVRTT